MALPLLNQASDPVAEIIHELESAYWRPTRALRLAVEHADEIAPVVIELVEKAAGGIILIPRQEHLLFWGIHILAAARCKALCRPLLRLIRNMRRDHLERLLGDATTETLPRVIISVFDGDSAALLEACADTSIDGFARWGLFDALARLTFEAAIPREVTVEFLARFERENLAEAGDETWEGWQDAIAHLGVEELYERVRATWRDGRSPTGTADQEFIEQEFAESLMLKSGDPAMFPWFGRKPIDDPVRDLGWTAQEKHEARVKREKVKAATDPAAAIAPQDFEMGWLSHFLKSDKVPATAMTAEQIDGFFHALICGPSPAPSPSEYMPVIWNPGDDPSLDDAPAYDGSEQAEYVTSLLARHWEAIVRRLDRGYSHAPILDRDEEELDARYWAGGFIRGVAMRAAQWGERKNNELVMAALNSMVMLGLDDENFAESDIDFDMRERLVDALPVNILRIHHLLRGRADPFPPPPPTRYEGRKVGRNEPCPCGSGKKFKRCCGSPERSFN